MATGIVSVAAHADHADAVSAVLAVSATAVYVVLLTALATRVLVARNALAAQLRDPTAALGFLTLVAASDVLASRAGPHWLETALGLVGLCGWLAFGAVALRDQRGEAGRRARREEVRGSWLLASVATSSLAVVAARLASAHRAPWLLAAAWLWWVLGLALYVLVAVPLARRALRGGVDAAGDHWIVMGALAIAGLAASGLVRASSKLGWAAGFSHVARVGEVALWIAASLLIPALVIVEARAWPPALGIERWSSVFPLGMYSAATYALRARTGSAWLETVATVFLWIAVAILVVVVAVAMRGPLRSPRPRSRSPRA